LLTFHAKFLKNAGWHGAGPANHPNQGGPVVNENEIAQKTPKISLALSTANFTTMKTILTVITLITACLPLAAQQNWDSIQVTSERVKDNIYMLKGSGGNIGVLTGEDGVTMIDDQFLQLGKKIQDAIAKLDKGPIRFTLNTHIHGDHSGSNEYFKQLGSTVIAHDLVRERMIRQPREKDAWPLITFPAALRLHLNGQDVDLLHFGPGHTDGDVVIHFKQANVFHMGDLFVRYGYPYIDMSSGGNINGLIENVDKALALMDDQSLVIPGHGELSRKGDVKKYRDRLVTIRDKVAAALKQGKKREDLAGLGITTPFDEEWGKGFIKGKDFVMVVAAGLE
jgi:glyoxylase-like metal-dependent hydrolase (beta-lactamase superfamily II)